MDKRELGAALLKQLGALPGYVKAFAEDGLVTWSADPYGFAYYVDGDLKDEVDRMEEAGKIVYAIIRGSYSLGDGEVMEATTFLFVDDEDLHTAIQNEAEGKPAWTDVLVPHSEEYGYIARARVVGFFDELGDVCVKSRFGGLTRTS